MKLVVGLGNYGSTYERTRHNAGWIVLDQIMNEYQINSEKKEHNSIIYFANVNGEKVLFVKPQTYMNNSGTAVQQIMSYYKIPIEDLIVIHDEKDFPVGKNQFKNGGSPAGHNGIKSLIQHLGTQDFKHYRIGIGQPEPGWQIIDWVMSKISDEELKNITENGKNISSFINEWTNKTSFSNIMNKYNK